MTSADSRARRSAGPEPDAQSTGPTASERERPAAPTAGAEARDPATNSHVGGSGEREGGGPDGFPGEAPDPAGGGGAAETEGAETAVPEPEVPTPDLAAQYLDQLQRLKAEFDNYRKRIAREKEAWWRDSRASVLSELLPVVDDVARARAFEGRGEALDSAGTGLILKRFSTMMSKLGLEEMETAPGTVFDPELHEAVLSVSSSEAEGCIVETIEPGYTFEGQILRRGKVTVSSGSPPE